MDVCFVFILLWRNSRKWLFPKVSIELNVFTKSLSLISWVWRIRRSGLCSLNRFPIFEITYNKFRTWQPNRFCRLLFCLWFCCLYLHFLLHTRHPSCMWGWLQTHWDNSGPQIIQRSRSVESSINPTAPTQKQDSQTLYLFSNLMLLCIV